MHSCVGILRAIHEIAGVSWYGEVFFIVFILSPALKRLPPESKGPLMLKIFPRIFHAATILASTAVGTGLALAAVYGGTRPAVFLSGPWGLSILAGGLMGSFILVVHLVVESRELRALRQIDPSRAGDFPEALQALERKVAYVPRAGLAVLTGTLLLMIYASHGL